MLNFVFLINLLNIIVQPRLPKVNHFVKSVEKCPNNKFTFVTLLCEQARSNTFSLDVQMLVLFLNIHPRP